MATFTERMTRLEQSIDEAVSAVQADRDASPVLAAVLKEFEKKFGKARDLAGDGSDAAATKLAVAEVEQAGDSAKAAAEADAGLGTDARDAVLKAHDIVCVLKTKL